MGLNRLIHLAIVLAVLAASTGQLPRIIREVHVAQFKLLREAQASKWGQAMLLPPSK